MIVFVKKEDEAEFFKLMIHERKGQSFTGFRENKYLISDKDYDMVKHIAKRCRG
jgi:hypothetical protein